MIIRTISVNTIYDAEPENLTYSGQPTENMREIAYIAKMAFERGISFDEARKIYDAEHIQLEPIKPEKICSVCGFPNYRPRSDVCSRACREKRRWREKYRGEPKHPYDLEPFDLKKFAEGYNEGLNDKEIGALIGKPTSTVRSRRHKYRLPANTKIGGTRREKANHGVKITFEELLAYEGKNLKGE